MTCGISIHALREEGDAVQAKNSGTYTISIHALREEGDVLITDNHILTIGSISIHALREEGDASCWNWEERE